MKNWYFKVMGDYPINKVLDFLIIFKDFDYIINELNF